MGTKKKWRVKPKIVNWIFRFISFVLFCYILGMLFFPDTMIKLTGFQFYTVLSGSMEPTLNVGGVIIVEKVDPMTLQEGDIITTSGAGSTYPKDIIIGVVESVQKSENDISQYAVIRPFEDLTTVKEVFVITDFPGKGEGEAQLDQDAQTGGEDPE